MNILTITLPNSIFTTYNFVVLMRKVVTIDSFLMRNNCSTDHNSCESTSHMSQDKEHIGTSSNL